MANWICAPTGDLSAAHALSRCFVYKILCPPLAEVLMLPYLAAQKYLVKSAEKPETQSAGERAEADLSAGSLVE